MKTVLRLSLLILGLTHFKLSAQNEILNHKKYWYYHYRLVNDFLAKGDCNGCSLPMNQRAANDGASTLARWGDQTISLAEYISVLATEYRLLKNAGQPADTTIQELYYALKALNRLDAWADPYYTVLGYEPGPSDMNGFFIRDDVHSGFLSAHPKLAQGVTSSRVVNSVQSDYYSLEPGWDKYKNEMSLDQVCHLYMGLALVSKFVDPGENYQGQPLNILDGNTLLQEEARRIANRITNYIKNTDWLIKNPITNTWVTRGHDFVTLSYGAAQAACYIDDLSTALSGGPPFHYCNDYRSYVTEFSSAAWANFSGGVGGIYTVNDESFKVQILAAIGNSWYTSLIVPPAINITEASLAPQSIIRDYQHLPLLRQVLHGDGNPVSNSTYTDLMNSAPCEGPFCYDWPGNSSTFEWSCSDRLYIGDERGGAHGAPYNKGEYNGMAYMLYYNLYYLAQGSLAPYINYMDRVVTYTFPTPLNIGLAPGTAIIEGFNTVTANNSVNSNAGVVYHAGQEIHLKPGFHADAGAEFHAYIEPFECALGDYRTASAGSSGDLIAYAGPTTYIDYPKINRPSVGPSHYIAPKQTLSKEENLIRISPNPHNGSFVLDSDKEIHGKVFVYGTLGDLVMETEIHSAKLNIDITGEPKGLYFVKIESGDEVRTIKMIHQ